MPYEVVWHGAMWRDIPQPPVDTYRFGQWSDTARECRSIVLSVLTEDWATAADIHARLGGSKQAVYQSLYRLVSKGRAERMTDSPRSKGRQMYRRAGGVSLAPPTLEERPRLCA